MTIWSASFTSTTLKTFAANTMYEPAPMSMRIIRAVATSKRTEPLIYLKAASTATMKPEHAAAGTSAERSAPIFRPMSLFA